MNLQDFVSDTLVQIRNGVVAANNAFDSAQYPVAKNPVFRLPPPVAVTPGGMSTASDSCVQFDVAVTVAVGGEASMGGKASIKIVEGQVGGKLEGSREHVSRVRFSIQVVR